MHMNTPFTKNRQSGKRADYIVNPQLTSERHIWAHCICDQIFITMINFSSLNFYNTHLPLKGISTECVSFIFLTQNWSMK